MSTRKAYTIITSLILISLLIGGYLYPYMPDRMASHWDAQGNVDGHMPKFWGLFLMPGVSAVLLLVFIVIPRIDPLKENLQSFRKYFNIFILLLFGFLFYLYLLTISWNLGYRFDIVQLMAPAFGLLIFYAGVMTENARQNWFIGVRTPWTLSSKRVWEKTNLLAGKLFKAAGCLAAFAALWPAHAIYIIIVPVLLAAVFPIIYSYREYNKESKEKSLAAFRCS